MKPEQAAQIDDRVAFVLGSRVLKAISEHRWDDAVRGLDLLEPVIARLGAGIRETEFNRYIVSLAKALPTTHPREQEFVRRALNLSPQSGQNGSAREEADKEEELPVGLMTPFPLPLDGPIASEDSLMRDTLRIRARF